MSLWRSGQRDEFASTSKRTFVRHASGKNALAPKLTLMQSNDLGSRSKKVQCGNAKGGIREEMMKSHWNVQSQSQGKGQLRSAYKSVASADYSRRSPLKDSAAGLGRKDNVTTTEHHDVFNEKGRRAMKGVSTHTSSEFVAKTLSAKAQTKITVARANDIGTKAWAIKAELGPDEIYKPQYSLGRQNRNFETAQRTQFINPHIQQARQARAAGHPRSHQVGYNIINGHERVNEKYMPYETFHASGKVSVVRNSGDKSFANDGFNPITGQER